MVLLVPVARPGFAGRREDDACHKKHLYTRAAHLPLLLVAAAAAKPSGLRRGRGASRTFGASYRTTLVGTCVPAQAPPAPSCSAVKAGDVYSSGVGGCQGIAHGWLFTSHAALSSLATERVCMRTCLVALSDR